VKRKFKLFAFLYKDASACEARNCFLKLACLLQRPHKAVGHEHFQNHSKITKDL
jgi:hypothetical protein